MTTLLKKNPKQTKSLFLWNPVQTACVDGLLTFRNCLKNLHLYLHLQLISYITIQYRWRLCHRYKIEVLLLLSQRGWNHWITFSQGFYRLVDWLAGQLSKPKVNTLVSDQLIIRDFNTLQSWSADILGGDVCTWRKVALFLQIFHLSPGWSCLH